MISGLWTQRKGLRGPTNVLAWYDEWDAESMVRRCWRPDSNRQGPKPNDLWDRRVYQFRHASTYFDDKLWQSSYTARGRSKRLDRSGNIGTHVWYTATKLMHDVPNSYAPPGALKRGHVAKGRSPGFSPPGTTRWPDQRNEHL